MLTSRYGRSDRDPDWKMVVQLAEYDIYELRSTARACLVGKSLLFVWGKHGFQHTRVQKRDVLAYYKSVPVICAWFSMEYPDVKSED